MPPKPRKYQTEKSIMNRFRMSQWCSILNKIFRRTSTTLVLLVTFTCASASAQTSIDQIAPENATQQNYGQGWFCDLGYRETKGTCVAIIAPKNAYLNNRKYGTGWDCERGFSVRGLECVEVIVPENGHLKDSGNDWLCNRPLVKRLDRCVDETQ